MSAPKHTPGPWYWRSGSDDYAALLSETVGGPIIQTTHGVDPETPDAKLIAAAPEQQAKIEALADVLEKRVRDNLENGGRETDSQWMAAACAALRAVGRLQ